MDRQCRSGCKDCWVKELEIYSHELGRMARTSPEGQGSWCAVISKIMTAKKNVMCIPCSWFRGAQSNVQMGSETRYYLKEDLTALP